MSSDALAKLKAAGTSIVDAANAALDSPLARKVGEQIGQVRETFDNYQLAFRLLKDNVSHLAHATALQSVSAVSVRNAKFVQANEQDPNDPYASVTARTAYLEAAGIALWCVVHTLIMSIIWGIFAAVQVGSDNHANMLAKRTMLMCGISVACIGVGIVGAASPYYGAQANGGVLKVLSDNKEWVDTFLNG